MFRFLLVMVASIFVLSVLRMIAGALSKGFSDLMSESGNSGPQQQAPPRGSAKMSGGELKRDPVCGTYIPADHSVRKIVNGETLYFCSPECRDKYA